MGESGNGRTGEFSIILRFSVSPIHDRSGFRLIFTPMRVVSGSAGGIHLKVPKGHKTRPTADQVREAIFNIITSRYTLAGVDVLDLFAGTGALGIEALSRGA